MIFAANSTILDKRAGTVRVIVESTKGCRNKYKYLPEFDLFECGPALQGGLTWPFSFGFVPQTLAEDGDPLDVIILMDSPAYPGCLVSAKILGVIEAEQVESGKTMRNDRIIAVHEHSLEYSDLKSWQDLTQLFRKQVELFFNLYMTTKGKVFEIRGWRDRKVALNAIEAAMNSFALSKK